MPNWFCVSFQGLGLVPVHHGENYRIIGMPPGRVGDQCLIRVGGEEKKVILLRSQGMLRDSLYLVDTGC